MESHQKLVFHMFQISHKCTKLKTNLSSISYIQKISQSLVWMGALYFLLNQGILSAQNCNNLVEQFSKEYDNLSRKDTMSLAKIISEYENKSNGIQCQYLKLYLEGVYRLETKNYSQALESFKEITKSPEVTSIFLRGRIYKYIGDILTLSGNNFRASLDAYEQALSLLKKSNQQALLDDCMLALGSKMFQFGDVNRAVTYYQRALENLSKSGDINRIIQLNIDLSKVYFYKEVFDSSLVYSKIATNLLSNDKNDLRYLESAIYTLQLLALNNDLQNAHHLSNELYKSETLENSAAYKALFKTAIVNILLKEGKLSQANETAEDAAKIIKALPHKTLDYLTKYYLGMATAYQSVGDYLAANIYYKKMDRYKDGLRSRNVEKLTAEFSMFSEINVREKEIALLNEQNKMKAEALLNEKQLRYEIEQKNILIDSNLRKQEIITAASIKENELINEKLANEKLLSLSLNRENELKALRLKDEHRFNNLLWLALIGLLMLSGIILYLYSKQKQKNNIIHKQVSDLAILNKEIHHRVKNNLQVISSILDIQAHKTKNASLKAFMQEGIQRIQSMAFIHQNLQNGTDANTVDMKEYINILSEHLVCGFISTNADVTINTDLDSILLSPEKAISIGMIINELISNSLKYAFQPLQKGHINITFKSRGPGLELVVSDNGKGLSDTNHLKNHKSAGLEIVNAFAKKLKGKIAFTNENGLVAKLEIPNI